jgi:hypothetical protein
LIGQTCTEDLQDWEESMCWIPNWVIVGHFVTEQHAESAFCDMYAGEYWDQFLISTGTLETTVII